MSDSGHSSGDGGISADHKKLPLFPSLVAPTTDSQRNTIRHSLIPCACWKGNDMLFDFDSSLVLPAIRGEMRVLRGLMLRHSSVTTAGQEGAMPSLTVFGHADPVGSDEFNKALSGRRAQAIYALLIRDVKLWDQLFNNPLGNDDWHRNAIETMQRALGREKATRLIEASRHELFLAYMDGLCNAEGVSGEILDFRLQRSDFLGGGADSGGKGDYQGCGEFNPLLVFSEDEAAEFAHSDSKGERDGANAPNRRVVIFLFKAGAKVDAATWPCPRVKEGTTDCTMRFWSNAPLRRQNQQTRREQGQTDDTFACRFYDRLARLSPCERLGLPFDLRLWLFDREGQRMPEGTPYRVRLGQQERKGKLEHRGLLVETNMLRTDDDCLVEWGIDPDFGKRERQTGSGDILKKLVLEEFPGHPFYVDPCEGKKPEDFLVFEAIIDVSTSHLVVDDKDEVRARLANLGYPHEDEVEGNLGLFSVEYQLNPGDVKIGLSRLRDVHRSGIEAPLARRAADEVPTTDDLGNPFLACPHLDPSELDQT